MITIELDARHEDRLTQMAKDEGQDAAELARHILVNFLDFQELVPDSDEEWAKASVALTPEIMVHEDWDQLDDGSK
jgi:predicted transcriptional regulator